MLRFSRVIGSAYIVVCLVTLVATLIIGPLGYAPFALVAPRIRPPVVVTIWHSTEQQAWLKAAVQQFAASNPTANGHPIQIVLKGLGSGAISERVARKDWGNDTPPTAISPASSLWVETLKSDWAKSNSTPIITDAPVPLVLTPLVILGWDDRTKLLWPSAPPPTFWRELHDTFVDPKGWAGHGGREEWGPIKFGHTSPLTSNSGAQTLMLLAYGYFNKTSGLSAADIQNPDFQKWLVETESAAQPPFADSSTTFINTMLLRGPSTYDFGLVYENIAIQSLNKPQTNYGKLHVYYPPATLLSDHPFATLQGDWTTADQRAGAVVFRDFLLSRPIQELALQYGLRPSSAGVSVTSNSANNPFVTYQQYGIQANTPPQAETPSGDVLNALLDVWQTKMTR